MFVMPLLMFAGPAHAGNPCKEKPSHYLKWTKAQVRLAKKGTANLVKLPINVPFLFACACPDVYVGAEHTNANGVWLDLTGNYDPPLPTRKRQITSIVVGYFTGNVRRKKIEQEWFRLYEFEVVTGRESSRAVDMCVTLATKKQGEKLIATKKISDKKPYGVIAASVPYFSKGKSNLKRAKSTLARLMKKGVTGLTMWPSTAFERLACCYYTILAGRYETKAMAVKRVKALKRKRMKAYYRRLF
jgi:hypothetical protein